MTFIARTKLQAVSDGPFSAPPRTATIVKLPRAKQKNARWWLPFGCLTLLAGSVLGASWNGAFRLPSFSISLALPPMPDITMLMPDAEASEPYAETIMPPPSDVVVPIPIVASLPPSLEKTAGNSIDLSAGITLPASSLQVPDPAEPPEAVKFGGGRAVAQIVNAISDSPALVPLSKAGQAEIEVKNDGAPATAGMIQDARAKLEADDDVEALSIYNAILAHDKNNLSALAGQAFAAQRLGNYEVAVKAERHLLALDPNNQPARINLVAALSAWDEPPALKELQHLVAAKPDFAPAQVALAQRLASEGDVLGALPHMRQASELEPNNVFYKLDLAVTYDKLGHSGEAVELYRDVLKIGEALDHPVVLPVSRTAIRQRVGYLEKLMASVDDLPAEQ